jgi:hypothetical protein
VATAVNVSFEIGHSNILTAVLVVYCGTSHHSLSVSHIATSVISQSSSRTTSQSTNQPISPSINRTIMPPSSRVQSAVYAQSPLRNITTHDDQPPIRSSSTTRLRRSGQRISLRDAISNALGSGAPVELLPNAPKRTSSLSDRTSNSSSPAESRRSSGVFFTETASTTKDASAVDSLSTKVGSDVEMPPVSWSLDDVVFATPAGKGRQ